MTNLPVPRILKGHVLRIRKLLIVVEDELSSQRRDRRGMRVDSQSPHADIDIVHAVVPHVAATELIPPAPNARQQVRLIRTHRRGAEPGIVVQLSWWIGRLGMTNRSAALAVPDLCYQDVADR